MHLEVFFRKKADRLVYKSDMLRPVEPLFPRQLHQILLFRALFPPKSNACVRSVFKKCQIMNIRGAVLASMQRIYRNPDQLSSIVAFDVKGGGKGCNMTSQYDVFIFSII